MNEDENFKQIMQLLSFYSPAKRAEEWIIAEAVFNSSNYSMAVEEIEKTGGKISFGCEQKFNFTFVQNFERRVF